mgnify:CR=1 FL=1
MPSFDVVSKLDHSEVENALVQAQKEIAQRYDFRDTGTELEKTKEGIIIRSDSDGRLGAALVVLQEKMVKRKVSLKSIDYGKVEEASGATVRLTAAIVAGISSDKARELNKFIKALNLKGIQSQAQGDQLRVTGKKRDDLQGVIAALKEADLGIPLQFNNFRD